MSFTRKYFTATALATVALIGTACSDDDDPAAPETPGTIVEVASGSGSFSTLVAAVEAAGLTSTLSAPGPFTVFAPTDDAFAKLPAGTVDALLADPAALSAILTYHVVQGRVPSSNVVNLTTATTVNGQSLSIRVSNGVVYVNDARVVTTDIQASNGIIHVIDTVLLPGT
jgi:uncharacterized surface protein with fasciclin (FAS1) repeats